MDVVINNLGPPRRINSWEDVVINNLGPPRRIN
jgi:hypothetical protein